MKKILTVLLGLTSVVAFADPADLPVYVTGAFGATTSYTNTSGAGGSANGQNDFQSSGGYDLSGNIGYNFNRNFAIEAGYTNIWNAAGSDQYGITDVAVRGTVALGEIFSLYGRLGVAGYSNTPNGSMTVNTLGVLYGMGTQFDLSKHWALTAEYWNVTGASNALSNGTIQGGVKLSF